MTATGIMTPLGAHSLLSVLSHVQLVRVAQAKQALQKAMLEQLGSARHDLREEQVKARVVAGRPANACHHPLRPRCRVDGDRPSTTTRSSRQSFAIGVREIKLP